MVLTYYNAKVFSWSVRSKTSFSQLNGYTVWRLTVLTSIMSSLIPCTIWKQSLRLEDKIHRQFYVLKMRFCIMCIENIIFGMRQHTIPIHVTHCCPPQHISVLTLAQVMAYCLTAPSQYLNQCWLIIREFLTLTSGQFHLKCSLISVWKWLI